MSRKGVARFETISGMINPAKLALDSIRLMVESPGGKE